MTETDEHPSEESVPAGELWIDRYIYPALRESTLLPLLLVVIGHVVAFVAPAILFAIRDGSFGARVALLGMAFLTYSCTRFEWRRHGRPGLLSTIVCATWILSVAAAWAANRYDLF